jgi:nucleoid-associated protein YgaU
VSGSNRAGGGSAVTPAVLAATAFAALAALASVAFVAARGGLPLPSAATPGPGGSPVAIASPATSAPPGIASPSPTAALTQPPTGSTPSPSEEASPSPGVVLPSPTPLDPHDPLLALPGCPDRPGCYVYTVRRGDSYTAISDRFRVLLWIMDALNPEIADPGLLVIGQAVYLGHDPMARLNLCRDGTCHRYVVRSGETLSTIAGRYGVTVRAILDINPDLDPRAIGPGDVIRLPLYQAP